MRSPDSLLNRLDPESLQRIMLALHRDCDCCEPDPGAPLPRFQCDPAEEDSP